MEVLKKPAQAQGRLFTITGPSGAGKDTLMHRVVEKDPKVTFFPTATTRAPRTGEVNGVDYHFLDEDTFQQKISNGEVLEWNHYFGNYYGTLKSVVEEGLQSGFDLMTDITWSGVSALHRAFPEQIVKVLILPPSVEELTRRFMERRKTSGESEEAITKRLEKIQVDIRHLEEKGYIFINDDMKGSTLEDYDVIIYNRDVDAATQELQEAVNHTRKTARA